MRRSWVEQVMGLPISVLARGRVTDDAEQAVVRLYAELREVDAVFSPYREDSAVSRVAAGQLALTDAPGEVQEVAHRCLQATRRTGGLFDATSPDGRWDPSGLVKGWAAERAFRHLTAVDDLDWCLNAGGDVVVACPSGEPFSIGIQDPFDGQRIAAALPLVRGAVATSSTSARGAHLYDPRTGAAAGAVASFSVTGPSLELADVLATAAFVAGLDGLDLVVSAPDYWGLLIAADGSQRVSRRWPG